MHKVKVKGILSAKNGMNLSRGCLHGCIYCDTRSNCYELHHEFEDIEIKENALELLEVALQSKRQKCMIGCGSMSDPYMPLKEVRDMTRGAMQIAYNHGCGFTLITKSTAVLEDLDLIKKINVKSKCVIQMTLTTYDENLCKLIEPYAPTTQERFQALKVLCDNGIPTIVWLSPILPFINDDLDNLKGILNYCKEAQVKGIICFGMGLTLRDGNREYYYQKLDEHFPNLKERYQKCFGNAYMIGSYHNKELMQYFHSFCEANGIMHDNEQIFAYLSAFEDKEKYEQLKLF